MEMTMNGQGFRIGGDRSTLSYSGDGEASSTGFEDFLEIFRARHSSGDLFDLVRQGGAGVAGSSMEVQPTSLRLLSPSPIAMPSSEDDDMAAWLYPIVSGQEDAVVAGHDDHQPSDDAARLVATPEDHKRGRPRNMEEECHTGAEDESEKCYSCGSTKKKATGGQRRSHREETHNLTEKRRRNKINEKLKTLRQLVPGCDDKVVIRRSSNQASTLDQTIRHIKSLQQQIEVMSFLRCGSMKPPPAAAVYPVLPPAPYLPPGITGGGVAAGLPPPAAALAPEVLAMARGHVVRRQGVQILAPPASPFSGPTPAVADGRR